MKTMEDPGGFCYFVMKVSLDFKVHIYNHIEEKGKNNDRIEEFR